MYSLALPILLRWVLCVDYYQMFWDEVHALRQSEANCIRHVQPWSWRNTWKGNFHFTRFYISIKCWDADIGYILVVFVFSTQGQWMNYRKQITVKIKSCAMKSGAEVFFTKARDAGSIILWSLWMEQKECDNAEYENTNLDLNLGEGSITRVTES